MNEKLIEELRKLIVSTLELAHAINDILDKLCDVKQEIENEQDDRT